MSSALSSEAAAGAAPDQRNVGVMWPVSRRKADSTPPPGRCPPCLRAANPPGVAARRIGGGPRFIHLLHPPLIARKDRRHLFLRAGSPEQLGPRQRERDRPTRSCQRPFLGVIAVVPPRLAAPLRRRLQRGPQFLVNRRLNRDADVLIDQLAQRDRFHGMRSCRLPATLGDGAFLRWPPCQAVGWSLTLPTGRMRHFSFPHQSGRHHGEPGRR